MPPIITVVEEDAELAAVSAGCQSTSHTKRACSGFLWQCTKCRRTVCCTDGAIDSDLCDACWAEEGANA